MCVVLLPPGVSTIAVKYIILHHIISNWTSILERTKSYLEPRQVNKVALSSRNEFLSLKSMKQPQQ
jgi:hypothetical protein